MTNFRPALSMTIAVVISLMILFFLGTWQAQKIAPKAKLIAAIEQSLQEGYNPLPTMEQAHIDGDIKKVRFTATLLDLAPLKLVNTSLKGKSGFHLYAPAKLQSEDYILINLGWIPFDQKKLPALPVGSPMTFKGVTSVTPRAGMMQPVNDPNKDIWYLADIMEMAAYFKLDTAKVYPVRLFADHWAGEGKLPKGGQFRMVIPNKHREYAFTWFGIAGALIAVYIAFGLQRGREFEQDNNK